MFLDFFTGCVGGCAGVATGHPFDTVKVRLISQDANKPAYRNGRHAFRKIIRNESVRGLFKGMSAPLYGQGFINAIVFGTQHNVMKYLPANSLRSEAVAGATAGLAQSVVASPMELARIRMSNSGKNTSHGTHQYKSAFRVISDIQAREGMRGVYRGFLPTVLRDTPAFALYFWTFEFLSQKFSHNEMDKSKRSPFAVFFAGGFCGMLSWFLIYPPDVVKTLMQDEHTCKRYKNILHCAKEVYRAAGIRGFFIGMPVAVLRAFPVNGVTFFVEEYSRQALNNLFGNSSHSQELLV